MRLILTQDVANLGKAGQLVNVKPGYGRNYLMPKGFAVTATSHNVKKIEHDRRVIEARVAKIVGSAEALAARLNGMTLQFERLVGEDDKLFGSVTASDIAEQLGVAQINVDRRKIQLDEPIKSLGKYEVPVQLHQGITAKLKFWVVSKDKA